MLAPTASAPASGLYVLSLTALDDADGAVEEMPKMPDADYRVKTKPGRICEAHGAS